MTVEGIPRLFSERLVLRPFASSDAANVERLAGAREVADTTLTIPHPYPTGSAGAWISTHGVAWERREHLTLAVCDYLAPDELLGTVSLKIETNHRNAEIGYWIGLEHWGQGYATEAARALVGHAFVELDMHRIQGRHFVRNPSSGRVMQKLGMQFEGIHRDAFRRWGQFEDVALYGLLADAWNSAVINSQRV